MTLVDRVNRQRSLTAISRARRSGRIATNASVLTTTYAYDPSGARVLQTSTTSTTYYPNKYYSLTSTKAGSNTYATSTNYIWNGDTLLATIDQRLYNGAATGSAIYRYIHPDHLGSTNAVTDQNGSLVQLMDYYPYGATRIATSTYPTNEKRQYIGQLYDQGSGLNYFNARYYNSQQGQFISQDPLFVGDPLQQNLEDPQSLNAYSYGGDNPITNSDPNGKVYGGFSFGGTLQGVPFLPGLIWTVGFNIDAHGIDFIANIGPGGGYKLDRVLYFSSGKLTHRPERQVSGTVGAAAIAGYDYAHTFSYPLGGSPANAVESSEHILVAGFGYGGGVTSGVSIPIIQWSPEPQDAWVPLSPLTFMSYSAIPADTHTACGLLCTPANTAQAKQGNSAATTPSTSSGGSSGSSGSGGGYGSPGTVYTNYGPANGHSACGTLCI